MPNPSIYINNHILVDIIKTNVYEIFVQTSVEFHYWLKSLEPTSLEPTNQIFQSFGAKRQVKNNFWCQCNIPSLSDVQVINLHILLLKINQAKTEPRQSISFCSAITLQVKSMFVQNFNFSQSAGKCHVRRHKSKSKSFFGVSFPINTLIPLLDVSL